MNHHIVGFESDNTLIFEDEGTKERYSNSETILDYGLNNISNEEIDVL